MPRQKLEERTDGRFSCKYKDKYFYGKTQNQIGEEFGLSGERIRQKRNRAQIIAKNALRKLIKENKFQYTNHIGECNMNVIFGV